jgi:hypothetical protein
MAGYINHYKDDDVLAYTEIINTEVEFDNPIINPRTKRKSRKYTIHGFIDMATYNDNDLWLWEHKTAAFINESYISRLWHDLQIMIYAINYGLKTGHRVKGIMYNVMQKVKLKQGVKETIEEFTARLTERYLTDKDLFHREEILVDNLRLNEVKQEVWQITQDMGQCNNFYKNRSQCYVFGECEYFKICNSGDNPLIIQNYYKEREDDFTNGKDEEENKPF